MRTTVDIDEGLLKRLRDEAHRRGVPFKQFLNRVLRRGIDPAPARRAKQYRCPTFDLGKPASTVNLDKALHLAGAMEDEETARELERRR